MRSLYKCIKNYYDANIGSSTDSSLHAENLVTLTYFARLSWLASPSVAVACTHTTMPAQKRNRYTLWIINWFRLPLCRESQQKSQRLPKKVEKLDFENLEELCSIDDNGLPIYDPILKNSEEIEQALSRKRKAEVEKALLSYHQLEKRLKSDISNAIDAFRDVSEGHNDFASCNSSINNSLLNSFQTNMCSKAAALDTTSNGIFQSLVIKSLET